MRKRLLFLIAVLVGIAGVPLLVLVTQPTPGATRANFGRIEDGMTREQVEHILGGPSIRDHRWANGWVAPDGEAWDRGDGGAIFVEFKEGMVHGKEWIEVEQTRLSPPSWSTKIRRWLGVP